MIKEKKSKIDSMLESCFFFFKAEIQSIIRYQLQTKQLNL